MLLGELLVSLRRFIFSCRLRIGSILYGTIRERHRNRLLAQRLDRWTIAKRSFFAQYEAQAMQFVAKNTALPIPRVHDVWIDGEHETRGWIVMDYIEGRGLDMMWPQMDASQRDRVRAQLACFLQQLRAIPDVRRGMVCSSAGGPVVDGRILMGRNVGPFASVAEFHGFLHAHASRDMPPDIAAKVPRPRRDDYHVVFTHADFHAGQILVDVNDYGKVAAVLDWEWAGWYPEYWEYTKAMMAPSDKDLRWREFMADAVGSYVDEEQTEWMLLDFQGAV